MEKHLRLLPKYQIVADVAVWNAIRDRLYEASSCKDLYEFAAFLEISPAQISDAKRCLYVPEVWLQIMAERVKANPAWIMTGAGERKI